jgi:hypothetical protein
MSADVFVCISMSADIFASKTFCTVPSLSARCTGDVADVGIEL